MWEDALAVAEPVLATGCTLPWTYLTLGRSVRKFFFLTLLTKKPYFLNVFARANLSTPIRSRLPTFPLLHGSVLRQSELGPGPAGSPRELLWV